MKKTMLMGAAILAASAAPAFAGDFDVTFGGFAAQTSADAEFINADKLSNGLSGTLSGLRLGAEYAFGVDSNGPFVGANWYSTIGDGLVSAPVRNGNYLVHHTVLDGFNGWELNAGWDFGTWALGAGYGELTRDVTTYQSCPEDWNAVVAGFCRGGGVPATAESREGLRGGEPSEDTTESWRFFGRYDVTEHLAITASYQAAEFDQSIAPLDVIGAQPADRVAHPPTSFAQDFEIFAIGAEIRF